MLDYKNSDIDLTKLLKTEVPLIKLFEIGNIKLVIRVIRYYLSQDNQDSNFPVVLGFPKSV